ncbi:aspartate-semialdehyde dehydrogenase [Desulfarculus baarsii DSM 2075]|uniref:Aspartate-semialdehyde dehydrogenase n=1 Tax=Desulfarculus baarsii (strain ATCC 33931 / DSM 2075 / LMG 7858 / VKM B-1802 / 2st14) TaxID=644282 RepID=E1QEZ0_DESB2|nr:aspartate-semialdehyde dehydrogenase [Desulfarculus baarsii]ADK84126.1 aspartate-semialdehyde dehydrogenase [Desulfarculus baarsii DSM 2075]
MSKQYRVAVAGATGAVGNQMIQCLEERDFPIGELRLLASERSRGKRLKYKGEDIEVQVLGEGSFQGVDIALFSAGGGTSLEWSPKAAQAGAVVIDNSAAWRMDPEVPLVVPEVNPHAVAGFKKKGIIANPNCSTIQMVVVLKPIHDLAGIERVVVSTYQAVSGTGQKAIVELQGQLKAIYCQDAQPQAKVYPHVIAQNVLPHIDIFLDNGYTKEEMKMVHETVKIMEDPTIKVSATCVRVPVIYGHSEACNITTARKISAQQAREALAKAPGVKVVDDPANKLYPMPLDAAGQDLTLVGRIREDVSQEKGLDLWLVADNIRKGAAANAVQIAELLIAGGHI